jgi:hypothetical protein
MTTMALNPARSGGMTSEERLVIFASSLGTVFEWYDFYIYGTLAVFLAKYFFSNVPANIAFIFTLLAFAAGFAVRPFGALIFGRLGDMIGRKYTFLITMSLMGIGTFFIGVLPGFATWGILAPTVLVGLRLVQGLALGGEYGGDPRPVHGDPAHPRHPHLYGRSGIRRLGLAASVPAVGDPARGVDLDPAQAQ